MSNWFIQKRGRALAVTTMGAALSAVLIIPFTQFVIGKFGWRTAWVVLGGMTWVILVLPAALIIRRRPEDIGLLPDGMSSVVENEERTTVDVEIETNREILQSEINWTAREALRTRAFWVILLSFTLSSLPLMGVWLHAPASFTDHGVSPERAAIAMGSVAITSLPARLFWGMIAERLHIRYCVIITDIGLAGSVLFIMWASTFPAAVCALLMFGVFVGGFVVFRAMVLPDYFGRLALGTIEGYADFFRIIGSAAGPLFAGFIYDATGSYYGAFGCFAGGCLVAAFLMVFAIKPEKADQSLVSIRHDDEN